MNTHNLGEIHALNQRSGRPLSLVDLINAGTVDLAVASVLAGAVASGATVLTAARPGNAGKTTLLAALLAFLPPGRRILTVTDAGVLAGIPENTCLLAHEIGSGPVYGYLWGAQARRYLQATGPGVSAASCIHADTLDELRAILCGPQIGAPPDAFARVGLVAFLRLDHVPSRCRRRVSAIYASTGAPGEHSHRRIFRWDEGSDAFAAEAPVERWAEQIERARSLLARLQAEGITDFVEVYANGVVFPEGEAPAEPFPADPARQEPRPPGSYGADGPKPTPVGVRCCQRSRSTRAPAIARWAAAAAGRRCRR